MRIQIEVPNAHIDSALLSPNSRYWASEAQWHRDPAGRCEGYVVDSAACSDSTRFELNTGSVKRALSLMATKTPRTLARIMAGDFDGDDGDILLQFMAFGELRYG